MHVGCNKNKDDSAWKRIHHSVPVNSTRPAVATVNHMKPKSQYVGPTGVGILSLSSWISEVDVGR